MTGDKAGSHESWEARKLGGWEARKPEGIYSDHGFSFQSSQLPSLLASRPSSIPAS